MSSDISPNTIVPGRLSGLGADILAARILIVDDMAIMRKMIAMSLTKAGFSNLIEADDGDIALEMIRDQRPDIVILDLNMPRMSGYEVCKTLRRDKATADIPILIQSAAETAEERVEVFAVGATDFVSKPINQPELLARVCMHLENRLLINSLESYAARVRQELDLARQMQEEVLPTAEEISAMELGGRLAISHRYEASSELGGDLWGGWEIDDHRIGLFALDVVGHGVASALNTFRIHATMTRLSDYFDRPALLLEKLNAGLAGYMSLGHFATILYGVLDARDGSFRYAGGGAPSPIVFDETGACFIDSSGYPVGAIKSATYDERVIEIGVNQSLLLYSDVMIESKDKDGAILGQDGFRDWVQAEAGQSGDALISALHTRLVERTGTSVLDDDLTLVHVRRGAK